MTHSPLLVRAGTETEVASGVFVVPDRRVNLVPNVGFVAGDDALLVVDTGMGPANGDVVLSEARRIADGRRLLLTLTHFHPEHGFGAQAFRGQADVVYNGSQAEELSASGEEFIELFKTFGPEVAEMLEGVTIVGPDRTYEGSTTLDLGGRTVELHEAGGAHTAGDQVVFVPDEGVLFAGDLVENRFFPIVFGPANGPAWIETLDRLAAFEPRVVVPGHGEVGGSELITAFGEYLVDVRDSVDERAGRGEDVDTFAAPLGHEIRARYADWGNDEWIEFAVRDFAARREA
jgi:glyoxylase-like metal-dependent hydrolase (beta-lactamase superfamily II)